MTGPAFEMPAFPAGWGGPTVDLIRIIDPLGEAIAWFAPDHGACCAGYAVRDGPMSSHSQTSWREIVVGSPSNPTVATGEHGDDSTDACWRFVERDPASCTMDWTLDSGARTECRRLTAVLANARLSLDLLVYNVGSEPIQAGANLRIILSSPPGIVTRLAVDASRSCPDDHPRQRNKHSRIELTVDAAPGPWMVETTMAGDTTTCLISDHRPKDPLPVIQPGMSRRLSVVLGPYIPATGL